MSQQVNTEPTWVHCNRTRKPESELSADADWFFCTVPLGCPAFCRNPGFPLVKLEIQMSRKLYWGKILPSGNKFTQLCSAHNCKKYKFHNTAILNTRAHHTVKDKYRSGISHILNRKRFARLLKISRNCTRIYVLYYCSSTTTSSTTQYFHLLRCLCPR